MLMNSVFLSDEEIIRVTDDEFVAINRENLKGTFDVTLGISTAETDQIKAQESAFMLQTLGSVLPFDLTKTILSEIALLRKMPDLAKKIKDYEQQPDPIAKAKAQLEVQQLQLANQKLQAEIQKMMVDAQVTSQVQAAKARNLEADTNLKSLDFVEQESGVKQERDLQRMKAQSAGNMQRDLMNVALKSTKGIL